MDDSNGGLPIHSLAEAHLYLLITPCESCHGPLQPQDCPPHHDPEQHLLVLDILCRECGRKCSYHFDTSRIEEKENWDLNLSRFGISHSDPHVIPPINLTDQPSEIIDVAGWLMLYGFMIATADKKARHIQTAWDKALIRQLRVQARRCLQEALKFYEDDNDLPPETAFYNPTSQRQFHTHPERFVRDRLISLRAQLPFPRKEEPDPDTNRFRPWWRFWPLRKNG